MYKVSVITINRNNAAGLDKTIQSVISQSYPNVEYIVIDGASTDGSVDIIKKHAEGIDYWVSEPDKGIYNAMNKGVKRAKGDYLFFLNSGDYLYAPTALEKIIGEIQNEDVAYGNIGVDNGRRVEVIKSAEKVEFYKRYQHNLPPHPGIFIRRELFDKVGLFEESYKIISDVVLIARIFSSKNTSYKFVDELITVFNMDGVSSSQKNQQMIYEERKRFILSEFPQYLSDFESVYHRGFFQRALSFFKKD